MPSKRSTSVSSKKFSSGSDLTPEAETKLLTTKSPKLPMPNHRAAPETDTASARKSHRKRRVREFPDADGGKGPQQSLRVWNDEDAVALLRGAVEFRTRNGSAPTSSDMVEFFASLKNSLPPQITQEQVYNKLRHLRHRHLLGGGPGAHGLVVQRLCDRLWASEPKTKFPNGTAAVDTEEDTNGGHNSEDGVDAVGDKEGDVVEACPYLVDAMGDHCKMNATSSTLMVSGLRCADPAKAKVLDEKWRRHWQVSMKLKVKQLEMSGKLHEMLVTAQKSSSL